MIAFEKAIEAGCEGIEMDVHFTKDGKIVIIHDELIDRTSDGKGFVKDYTYDELKKFDFSYTYGDKVGFCRIPTLEEFMELVHDKEVPRPRAFPYPPFPGFFPGRRLHHHPAAGQDAVPPRSQWII